MIAMARAEQARDPQFLVTGSFDAYLAKLSEKAECVADHQGDRCRGFVAFYCNDSRTLRAFITLVLVDPRDRGHGVGRALVGQVLDVARSRGFRSCALEVSSQNAAAKSMYQALGFMLKEARDGRELLEVLL
ncbi:MAG TPA: GNAT family N-acetyltransferase [Vicinamibacterales bacterium]|nr:GNAT family N-acetyltransferase [Vicinamibacterales bacterium]